ncbi:hypothetical protein E2C01_090085 [Portunus trituberculatus]|uniref:Uncharacterized protein n=1 Tax=Portunus trituberculatus TaxID=210409 RepID=A0A5B7JJZ3_PORTR|nr:hypothetical protein [Portunus trituberculatus]
MGSEICFDEGEVSDGEGGAVLAGKARSSVLSMDPRRLHTLFGKYVETVILMLDFRPSCQTGGISSWCNIWESSGGVYRRRQVRADRLVGGCFAGWLAETGYLSPCRADPRYSSRCHSNSDMDGVTCINVVAVNGDDDGVSSSKSHRSSCNSENCRRKY